MAYAIKEVLKDILENAELVYINHPKGSVVFVVSKRDKHMLIKCRLTGLDIENVFTVYAVNGDKVHHVYGPTPIFMKTENYKYILKYPELDTYGKKALFYKEISFLVYQSKTKNALVIGTDGGMIPVAIAKKINRVYAIETDYKKLSYAKSNFTENRAHNVLGFSGDALEIIASIKAGEQSAPGKKININIIVSHADISKKIVDSISDFKPIAFLLYGTREKVNIIIEQISNKLSEYILDKELFVEGTFIARLRKEEPESQDKNQGDL